MPDFQTTNACEKLRIDCGASRSSRLRWIVGIVAPFAVTAIGLTLGMAYWTAGTVSTIHEKTHVVNTRVESHIAKDEAETRAIHASLQKIELGQERLTERIDKFLERNGGG